MNKTVYFTMNDYNLIALNSACYMFLCIACLSGMNVYNLKVKVNVNFTLEQAMEDQMWNRSVALLLL